MELSDGRNSSFSTSLTAAGLDPTQYTRLADLSKVPLRLGVALRLSALAPGVDNPGDGAEEGAGEGGWCGAMVSHWWLDQRRWVKVYALSMMIANVSISI